MALFQKKPQFSAAAPLYSIGAHKTVLVVGLGNPGKKYNGTRHSIGFAAIEKFAQVNDFTTWTTKKDLRGNEVINNLGDSRVILFKPNTFMNLSGEAVSAVQHFYKVPNSQTLVVYDELAIPFGQIRTRVGGSDAGHNGIKSLIQYIGADFNRIRLGINNTQAKKIPAEDFVLSNFTKAEQGKVDLVLQETCAIITEFIFSGELPQDTRKILN